MFDFLKRIIDLIIAFITLILLLPIFVFVIIILLFTGEGKVFYLQKRLGFKNKSFKIIKFATMLKNSPNIGSGSITLRDDPRVLPFGKFLRKSKINELPQIFNVIRGEMSIVGPRPQMEVDFNKFPKDKRDHIYLSKPGITGIGSIVFRDEEKWISSFKGDKHHFYRTKIAPYKTELELWYLKNKSIILAAWVILFPKSQITSDVFDDLPTKPDHLN